MVKIIEKKYSNNCKGYIAVTINKKYTFINKLK